MASTFINRKATKDSAIARAEPVIVESQLLGHLQVKNEDELRLAEMGHNQELKRHFSMFALIGLASTCTVSWTGLGLALVSEINAGGPCSVIYGFVLCTLMQCFVGSTIAELVSAYPVEGGMYHWAAAVAPRKYSAQFAFFAGWFSVVGWLFITASTVLIFAQTFMAFIAIFHEGFVVKRWQVFVVYQGFNFFTSAFVLFRNNWLPKITRGAVVYEQLAWVIIIIVVLAKAPKFQPAKFVFADFINNTGWSNPIAFITGLINPLYAITGLDGISHIAEEMPNPSRNAPIGIAACIAFAFVSGFAFVVAIMFCIQDFNLIATTPTGLPLAELFFQAVGNRGGGFVLVFMTWMAVLPTLITCQLAMSRVTYAFSRDDALPFSNQLKQINLTFESPFKAQLACTTIVAALGCIYLGSSTAFSSLLASAVNLVNLSYLPSFFGLVLTSRATLHSGAYQLPHKFGMFVNLVASLWVVFQVVFFSFPFYLPLTAQNMNYNCVVIGGCLILVVVYWFIKRKVFAAPMIARAKEQHLLSEVSASDIQKQ